MSATLRRRKSGPTNHFEWRFFFLVFLKRGRTHSHTDIWFTMLVYFVYLGARAYFKCDFNDNVRALHVILTHKLNAEVCVFRTHTHTYTLHTYRAEHVVRLVVVCWSRVDGNGLSAARSQTTRVRGFERGLTSAIWPQHPNAPKACASARLIIRKLYCARCCKDYYNDESRFMRASFGFFLFLLILVSRARVMCCLDHSSVQNICIHRFLHIVQSRDIHTSILMSIVD